MGIISSKKNLHYSITLFIIIQVSSFALLGFWIFWFVSNNAVYTNLSNFINPYLLLQNNGTALFVFGLILIFLISTGLIFIFIRLIRQIITNRIYDGFISNITHELKSPLSSIHLGLETLQKRHLSEEIYSEFLSRMAGDIKRLNKLIDSILEISIIDSKGDFFEPVILSADISVRTIVKNLYSQFSLDDSNISIEGHPECNVKIDPAGLETVLSNLIDNSIKYSRGPVKIKIRLERVKNKFIINFSDEGIGISEKDRKTVFNKFTRIKRSDSPSVKGTGIGLYWCRQILKINNGRILIQKTIAQAGTSFRIELPAVSLAQEGGLHYFE